MKSTKYTVINSPELMENKVCLTLDVEQDFGDLLEKPTYDGLKFVSNLALLIKEKEIPLTVFVQGALLEMYPEVIRILADLDAEFELHSYSHLSYQKTNTKYEVEKGKIAYKKYFGKEPKGYRFPSGIFKQDDYEILAANGFQFDSSVFPSLRPNAFNNLKLPTKPYYVSEYRIMELPFTVFSNIIRIPVALSYIKLLGWPYLQLIKSPLLPKFLIFNFHMHDLFKLPSATLVTDKESSLLSKLVYRRIYHPESDSGFVLLREIISMLQKRNYTFTKLETIYDLIVNTINRPIQ